MSRKSRSGPGSEFRESSHSVEELMDEAERHFEAGRFRAAVMEAFVALEEQIAHVVFTNLRKLDGFPDELVDWLDLKTRMDVAARIHPIGEAALGKPIGKETPLFKQYAAAKKIRNRVSHTASKVTRNEANQVLQTVREWLSFLENSEDAFPAIHGQPAAQEFMARFSILQSRFRLRKPDGSIATLEEAIRNASNTGFISQVEANELVSIVKIRNQLAHSSSSNDAAKALHRINPILYRLKGNEIPFLDA